MSEKYLVDLTTVEQAYLTELLRHGKTSARKLARAHILLQAAEGLSDEDIADTLRVGVSTIHRTRQRFVEEGLEPALERSDLRPHDVLAVIEHARDGAVDLGADARLLGLEIDELDRLCGLQRRLRVCS